MIVDLSVLVNNNTPVYPGDPTVSIKPAGILDKDGYSDHLVSIGTHVGTHMDAPMHMLEGGKSLDKYPAEKFVGPGKLVDLRDGQYDIELVKQAKIKEGEIVLFHSGLSKDYQDAIYFKNYPAMPADVAEYIVKQKVKMVGLDMCSPDHNEFVAHKILLEADVLIIENLTNLEKLIGNSFTVYALPIKLDIDGAPARVIAQL